MSQEEKWLLQEKYKGIFCDAYYKDLAKLKNGYPLAYLIGDIPFLNLKIYLDSKPLIPRSETEYWTSKIIERYKQKNKGSLKILDLCAGSGAIGLALIKNLDTDLLILNEIEISHFLTIEKNITKNKLNRNIIKIIDGDLFEKVDKKNKFDLIVSNPPYLFDDLKSADQEVVEYEPTIALKGGKDGLFLIKKIINQGLDYLSEDGEIYIEHDPWQQNDIADLAKKKGYKIEFYFDQFKVIRYCKLSTN